MVTQLTKAVVEAITVDNPWRKLCLPSKFPSIFYCWKTGEQREILISIYEILGAQKYMISSKTLGEFNMPYKN